MGKRSTFARRAQDAYFTPPTGLTPLFPHLPEEFTYDEPCAGDGAIIRAMPSGATCKVAMDLTPVEPKVDEQVAAVRAAMGKKEDDPLPITQGDALTDYKPRGQFIITNPPWTRQILHPMIEHFRMLRPTWLLFDADWMHTVQAEPYLKYCHTIVSVGRLSWMDNGKHGMDNCAWYLFKQDAGFTTFRGRVKK